MERTHPLPVVKAELSAYRETIYQFLPFVFIKCSKYSNSKNLAEAIAIYTFISVYMLAEILDGYNMPVLIECMISIVGEDLDKGTNISANGQLLFEREGVLNTAKTIAELDTYECLCLVLYYIENLDLDQIAEIMEKAIDKTSLIISKGQRLFIENLSRFKPRGAISLVDEIRQSMDSVSNSIDRNRFEQITDRVMDYLIKNSRQQLPLRSAFI